MESLIMSPPEGRLPADAYKFPRLVRWTWLSSFFPFHPSQLASFASQSKTQHPWFLPSYIAAATLT
jgi:hypothetical protein